MDEFDEHVARGEANLEAIELTRRHCRHARVELVHGNSMVGSSLDLPMGLMEVRCEHASPPHIQSFLAMDLAIDFYHRNCLGCAYRDGTGELPNLATVAAEALTRATAVRAVQQELDLQRAQRYERRRERRRQLRAGEGYVVQDLVDAIDRIDRPDVRTAPPSVDEVRDEQVVLDAARGAPQLFNSVLVDSLAEMAEDTADPTVLQAIEALVRSSRCSPRRAIDVARVVLTRQRSVEAGQLLASLEGDLHSGDLVDVLDQLINLSSEVEVSFARLPSSPEGLRAAARVDLPMVTSRIVEHLASDDDCLREAGADAASELLRADSTRITVLGPPLAASVRGPERIYGGEPHPVSAALGALAEGWRGEPELTCRIVENHASGANLEVRVELSRVPWFLQRFRESWNASDLATLEAVRFLVKRAAGDWGDGAADHAADHLESLAQELPEVIINHADELLITILGLCEPERDNPSALTVNNQPAVVAALERESLRMSRDSRRRRLALTLGHSASADYSTLLALVQAVLSAPTGIEDRDRCVRKTMFDILEVMVSDESLRDILPVTYTALLDADQGVRSAGIDLWVACARVADSLPRELTELAEPLLADSFVVVHSKMLTQIPQLHIPVDLALRLLPFVNGWLVLYASPEHLDPGVVASAVRAMRSLARELEEESQVTAWCGIALSYVDRCNPYDREGLLKSWWPDALRHHAAWVSAALATAASPALVDYYNGRSEPLLRAFMDSPQLLSGIALAEIAPLSTIHDAAHPWRALEVVELLQAAGRWDDALTIARDVEIRQPPGEEGASGKRLALAVVRAGELANNLVEGLPTPGELETLTQSVIDSVADIEASYADGVEEGQLRIMLDGLLAFASAAQILNERAVTDPSQSAIELEVAVERLRAITPIHVSASQREWIARSWQIAVQLLRFDGAARIAADEAPTYLQAARRQAQVLSLELSSADIATIPAGLVEFLTEVEISIEPSGAQVAWQRLGTIPVPVSMVGTSLLPRAYGVSRPQVEREGQPRSVCVVTMRGAPITGTMVLRRGELYYLGLSVRLLAVPDWAETCVVELVTTLERSALTLPRFVMSLDGGTTDEFGLILTGEEPLHCDIDQSIRGPALDCPLHVRLLGPGHDMTIEVAGVRRLLLRPFDPSRDVLTEHRQTDERLLQMFGVLDSPDFDTEDVRAFCRIFSASVRASQEIMFENAFMRGSRVTETEFHNEFERLLRGDPELEGRLTRRDAVAGGFDDLLHDDVIVELKVSRGSPITVEECVRYIGQPAQYGVGRGSQLSVLVVLDHSRKEAPPGVIENYVDWLKPSLHGLSDPRYPTLVGVIIVNTNLPIPSAWSRRRIEGARVIYANDSDSPPNGT